MARNSTLGSLLNEFRAESRLSLNPAHNNQTRDAHIILLQRTQEGLWEDFDWPHLRVERTLPLAAGQRTYSPPEDISVDRIQKIEFRFGGEWTSLRPGIGSAHYATWDSDTGVRSWPVERWRIVENEQIEIWPIPSENVGADLEGTLRVTGIRKLRPLIDDGDRADLDNRLIVLFAAAEYLASRGEKDAKLKLDQATKRYLRVRGNLMPRRRFSLGGNVTYGRPLRGPPRIHYRDRETI